MAAGTGLRRPRHPRPRLAERDLATAWQVVSLLLDYPTEQLVGRRPVLEEAVAGLPAPVREPVCRFLAVLASVPLGQLQRDYVETFDTTRRCCLYLTYFTHGDTRKRGLALVHFTQAYRRAGALLEAAELPDHLGVVLEFGASFSPETSWLLLNDHRAGIEMLRIALADRRSAWHDVVVALVRTLPELRGDDEEQVRRLVAQGPPSEEVGLDMQPYAMDPRLGPHPPQTVGGRVDLGPSISVGAPR